MSLFVEFLGQLPEEERTVLSLVYLQQRSIADIAGLLSVPERSVQAVFEQGRARVATLISQAGGSTR